MRLDDNYLDVPDPVTLGLAEAGLDTDEVEIVTDDMPPVRQRAPKVSGGPTGGREHAPTRWAVYSSPSEEMEGGAGEDQGSLERVEVAAFDRFATLRPPVGRASLPDEAGRGTRPIEWLLLVMGLVAGGLALFVAAHGP